MTWISTTAIFLKYSISRAGYGDNARKQICEGVKESCLAEAAVFANERGEAVAVWLFPVENGPFVGDIRIRWQPRNGFGQR